MVCGLIEKMFQASNEDEIRLRLNCKGITSRDKF